MKEKGRVVYCITVHVCYIVKHRRMFRRGDKHMTLGSHGIMCARSTLDVRTEYITFLNNFDLTATRYGDSTKTHLDTVKCTRRV